MRRRYARSSFVLLTLLSLLVAAGFVGLRFDLPASEVDMRYRTASSRFVSLDDGTRIHYWDRGKRDADVLILLHGSYDSAYTWSAWLEHLEPHYRVVVPDLPGHGLTGRTVADDYDLPGMVAAVHGLVDKLGIDRFDLAGNSMGGNTA